MDIRLMAFDLDGTLLGSDKHVPEKNRRALRKAAKAASSSVAAPSSSAVATQRASSTKATR